MKYIIFDRVSYSHMSRKKKGKEVACGGVISLARELMNQQLTRFPGKKKKSVSFFCQIYVHDNFSPSTEHENLQDAKRVSLTRYNLSVTDK